jgi:predicted N-acyltransferase
MSVEVVRDVDQLEWDRLLMEDPRSTFFHSLEWGRCLERALTGWERYLIVANAGGRVIAGLPAMRYSKRGFCAVMSMPFGTYGGPLVGDGAPPSAYELLVHRFFEEASSTRVVFAELVDFPQREPSNQNSGTREVEDETQILGLQRGYDRLYGEFRPTNRNRIRKAQKAGVTVRRGHTTDDYLSYHRVLLDCAKHWDGRVRFGRDFFVALSETDSDSIQLWLAEHDGNVVAALVNFLHGDSVMNWGNVMLRGARALSPMNLLHAEAIREAAGDGLATYNFGSSSGFDGVDAFKTTFGTTRVGYSHFILQKRWFSMVKHWSRGRRRR